MESCFESLVEKRPISTANMQIYTHDLGKINFFLYPFFLVPDPMLHKLLIFSPFNMLTSDPSPPILHCEVGRSSSLLCILATSDKMDAEGEPGMYMQQTIIFKIKTLIITKFYLCKNILQGSEEPCLCKHFLLTISSLVSWFKIIY